MTICYMDGKTQCCCQPDEGVECTHPAMPDAVRAELARLRAAPKEIVVSRLEVINHTSKGSGREYFLRYIDDRDLRVGFSVQDNGRTLKIFVEET